MNTPRHPGLQRPRAQPPLVAQCENLQEIRIRLDQTDQQLVTLLAQRAQYVRQAARFKPLTSDETQVANDAAQVIDQAMDCAREVGAPAHVVEATYRALIAALVDDEPAAVKSPTTTA